MTTNHDASCRCVDCRSRRAARAAQGLHQPSYVPVAPVRTREELEQEELEQEAREWEAFVASVRNDPMAFILASREDGAEFEAIAAMLAHSGIDDYSIAALMEEARSTLNATRLRRAMGRIALGVVVAAAGFGLSFGLSSLLSGLVVAFWGLMLAGLFLVGQGVVIMVKVERSGWSPPQ